ncbi:hypothetical protein ACH4TS_20460 [Streptomyces albidoflavus]
MNPEEIIEAEYRGTSGELSLEEFEKKYPSLLGNFDALCELAALASDLEQRFKALSRAAMLKADDTGPFADRRLIMAAGRMTPSTYYRLLEKHGMPRDRSRAQADDVADAVLVAERYAADDGTRASLDEVLERFGLSRADLDRPEGDLAAPRASR